MVLRVKTVDRNDFQPLVAQLKEIILAEIRSGKYAPGERIPSERELCKIYGVSRTTARNALIDLANAGHVTRAVGSGTYVADASQGASDFANGTIGFLLCRHHYPVRRLREDYFYFEVMEGIQEELSISGRHFLFHQLDDERREESLVRDLVGKVDGILLAEAQSEQFVRSIQQVDVPLVLINPSIDRLRLDLHTVSIDNRAGAYKGVRHLVELGHQAIGCIRGPQDSTPAEERYEGYLRALGEAGVAIREDWVELSEDWTIEAGTSATQRLIRRVPGLTAIFGTSDTLAVGVLNALSSSRRVPEEVSVVGFDDISIAAHANPPLTTVRSPILQLGKTSCRLLNSISSTKDLPTTTILFSPELVVRASTKRHLL